MRGIVAGVVCLGIAVLVAGCANDAQTVGVPARMATFAAGASQGPEVSIETPNHNAKMELETLADTLDITVQVDVEGVDFAVDGLQLRYYLDGVEVGAAASADPFQVSGVGVGLHQIAARVVTTDGQQLANAESLDTIKVKVTGPCQDTAECEDGVACTNAFCAGGECKFGPAGDQCCGHDLECPYNWSCVDGTCAECTIDSQCDDSNPCTTDLCGAGTCEHVTVEGCCVAHGDCDDGDPCTHDSCGLDEGQCVFEHNGDEACCGAVDDCAAPDACAQMACVSVPDKDWPVCQVGPPAAGCCLQDGDCDDGVACTADSCLAGADGEPGACMHDVAQSAGCCVVDADCADADPATTTSCAANTCKVEVSDMACELPATGKVVVTEFFAAGAASWIELYNTSNHAIDLTGWSGALSFGEHFVMAPEVSLPSRAFAVVAGPSAEVPGAIAAPDLVLPDVTAPDAPADWTLWLTDPDSFVIDAVYVNPAWPLVADGSVELNHPHAPNGTADNWQLSSHTIGDLYGTPGAVNSVHQDPAEPSCLDTPSICAVPTCTLDGLCAVDTIDGCCESDSDCNDDDLCTVDQCDMATNTCKPAAPVAGCCNLDAECVDGDACTADACIGNECRFDPDEGGTCCNADADCDDGKACTIDACNLALNVCELAEPVVIDDQQCCDLHEDCDDGDPATDGVCSQSGLCFYVPAADFCDSLTADCNDGFPCTVDYCDLQANTCAHVADPTCCATNADCGADGDACTVQYCDVSSGQCVVETIDGCCNTDVDCDDADACTQSVCSAGGECHTFPIAGCCADASDCDDAVACTVDSCVDGQCVFESGQACADEADLGKVCDSDLDCDDDILCTGDLCGADGHCRHIPADVYCYDDNVCTKGACVIGLGCEFEPLDGACDDGNPCTAEDACTLGECVGAAYEGVADVLEAETACGVGACTATGVMTCGSGVIFDACQPLEPAVQDSTCDGSDDDCDGEVDEDCVQQVDVDTVASHRTWRAGEGVGAWRSVECPPGTIAMGYDAVRGADVVERVRLICAPPDAGVDSERETTAWLGSAHGGGEPTSVECPAGKFLTRFVVRLDADGLRSFKGSCASLTEIAYGADPSKGLKEVGKNKGTKYTLGCKPGHVATGLDGAVMVWPSRVGFQCSPVSLTAMPGGLDSDLLVDHAQALAPVSANHAPACAADEDCEAGAACVFGFCEATERLCLEASDCGSAQDCDILAAGASEWGVCVPRSDQLDSDIRCEVVCSASEPCLAADSGSADDAVARCRQWCDYAVGVGLADDDLDDWASCVADHDGTCAGAMESCLPDAEDWGAALFDNAQALAAGARVDPLAQDDLPVAPPAADGPERDEPTDPVEDQPTVEEPHPSDDEPADEEPPGNPFASSGSGASGGEASGGCSSASRGGTLWSLVLALGLIGLVARSRRRQRARGRHQGEAMPAGLL